MKIQILNYTFDKTAGTVTFTDYSTISLDKILAIVNVTRSLVMYSPIDSTKGGTVASNILTLTLNTSTYNNADKLLIYYDDSRYALSCEVDLTMLNPTTTAYTLGDAVGASFPIPGASRYAGGTGILQSVELISTMPSGSYRNQATTANNASPCKFTISGNTLVNGNRVRMGATGTPPTGFVAGTDYYVVGVSGNDFNLAASIGGTAINSTSTGTSVTITSYPAQLSVATYITNATLGSVNDNDAFYPTEAQSQSKVGLFPLILDTLVFDYKENDATARNLGIPYKTASSDTNLYGIFLFTGSTAQVLVAGAKLRARINMLID